MYKAIFLDRDGTLNEDSGYAHKMEDYKLLPGVIKSLKRFKDYKLFIITNQSGIGRGFFSEDDMHKFNGRIIKDFRKENINIENVYYCPHSPKEKCDCRKPSPKYLLEAKKKYNLDLKNSFVMGDHASDVYLAKNANSKSVYLLTGHGNKHLEEGRKSMPDYIAKNFSQGTDYILFNDSHKITPRNQIRKLVNQIKKKQKKISFINGTFDILHRGHEKILKIAKSKADILIVGINTDSSVKKNKGPKRPLNNELNRAKMLAKFPFVDYVTMFQEKTPIKLLKEISPYIFVNGSEYGKDCLEGETLKEIGTKIHIVNLLPGHSTTSIISK